MTQYTFTFTLDQVNEIIACMNAGPYGRVNNLIQELQRQLQAQVKKNEVPAPPKNGEDARSDGPH